MEQLMQASLNSTAVAQYRPLQSLESKLFLRKLLDVKDSMEYRGHLSVYMLFTAFHAPGCSLPHMIASKCQ